MDATKELILTGELVYLLHFACPLWHAQHYIGWTRYLSLRLEHHRRGTGARLMAAVANAGIDFEVVRTWPNQDRNFERALKNRKNARKLCPICMGEGVI